MAFWIICASPAGAAEPVEVSILMPAPFAVATEELVADYNNKQSHIRLKVERGPLNTEAISDLAISSLLLGDTPYDLLLMDVTWTPKYVAADWLLPLEPWLGEQALDPLLPGARIGNTFSGHLWRMPLLANTGLLFYRKDLLEQPPRNTTELVEQSRQLQKQGSIRWGYVWQGRQYEGLSCDFLEIVHGFGGSWMTPNDKQTTLDTSEAIQAAAWMQSLIRDGASPRAVTNYAESETLQAFKTGDAALMRNWPYAWAELQKPDSAVQGKVGITLMPATAGHEPAATLGSWGLSLLRQSPHPEETVEAIRFLTSEASQKKRFLDNGYTPTAEVLFTDPELLAVSSALPDVRDALNHAVPRPPTPIYAQLSDVLQRGLNGLLTSGGAAKPGMDRVQTQSETVLNSAGGLS